MVHDWLRAWVENSQSESSIKEETLKILDEAKAIRASLDDDNAQKEYDEVRFSTISALKDLQAKTGDELEQIRSELWQSIAPLTYHEGEISQDELWDIKKEFSDLQQLASDEDWPNVLQETDLWTLWGLIYWEIQATNNKILEWGKAELQKQLSWYLYAFWSDTGTFSLSAAAAYQVANMNIESSRMQQYAWEIQAIQDSSENLHTKLFQLSQVLYHVTQEGGAPQWLEDAHHLATREIIKSIVEGEGHFAVGFNEKGYFMSESVSSTSSELEIGTYLCSLNKSGDLNKETLLSIFSSTELFTILARYKNWEFWDENVQWLFAGYLGESFTNNMQSILVDVINTAPSAADRSATINNWLTTDKVAVNSVLTSCDLCSKIDEYSYDDIKAMSDEELRLYQDTQPEFYQGLQKRLEHMENSISNIELHLTDWIKIELWEDPPQGLQEKIAQTAQDTYIFMGEYLWQDPQNICAIDIVRLFASDGSGDLPRSPLADFKDDLKNNYNINVSIYASVNTIVDTWFQTQINLANTNISTAQARIKAIEDNIPENERSEAQVAELVRLRADILEWKENIDTLNVKRIRAKNLDAERLIQLSSQDVQEIRRIMREFGIDGQAAINSVQSITYDFNNEDTVSIFLEEPHLIRNIRNIDNLILFLESIDASNSHNKINISMIHPDLRSELKVLREVRSLEVSDICTIPENFFKVNNVGDAHWKMYVLLSKSNSWFETILQKFAIKNIWDNTANSALQEALYHIVTDSNLDETKINSIKEFISNNSIIGIADKDRWNIIPWVKIMDPWVVELNANGAQEQFEARFSKMRQHGNIPQEWDIDFFRSYITRYGVNDILSQFNNLSQNREIPFNVIQNAIPFLIETSSTTEMIVQWIWCHGIKYMLLLSEKFRSDPQIIEASIKSIMTPNPNIDRPLQEAIKKQNLAKIANIINAQDTHSFLAIYNGLDGNIDLLSEYFWYTFDQETLNAIMTNAETSFNNRFSYWKIWTIREIIDAIKIRKEEEEASLKGIEKVKKRFEEEREPYMDAARDYIDQEITDLGLATQLKSRMTLYMSGSVVNVEVIVEILEEYYWEDSEGISKIEDFMDELTNLKLEAATSQAEAWARAMDVNSDVYSSEYVRDILWDGEFTPAEIVAKLDIAYLEYLEIEKRKPNETIEQYQERFLEYFLSKYNLSNAPAVDILNLKNTFNGIFIAHQAKIELENITEFVAAALNEDSEALNNFYNNGFDQLIEEAPERIIELEEKIGKDNNKLETSEPRVWDMTQKISDISTWNKSSWTQWETEITVSNWAPIPLSAEDISMLKNDPEKREDIVKLHSEFKDTKLEALYPYKDDIFKALWNQSSIRFNAYDGWYIDQREANVLFSAILFTATEDLKYKAVGTNLEVTKAHIKREVEWIAGEENVRTEWWAENHIEESFINKYTKRKTWDKWKFKPDIFAKALKWNFPPTA
jgi:hypothetical protein